MKDLSQVRQQIDSVDQQIQKLLNERAKLAQQVAEVKMAAGDHHFYRPEREAQVLREVKARNEGPLGDDTMARIFREVMSACLALEQPLLVAYLGPEGTFTQAAALKAFGHSVHAVPMPSIREVFREVEAENAHYGVVPVENSTEGVVNHTLDMFLQSPLHIIGEVELRIHHHLISQAEALEDIRSVHAHPQALAQCREWLDKNLPHAERVDAPSNAEAVRLCQDNPRAAAIAARAAAELYNVPVRVKNVEDQPNNTTRFLVIGREEVPPSGDDKTSLLLSVPNQPGALHKLLQPFAQAGIGMTRIESRPTKSALWEYVFFVDIDGHQQDDRVRQAISELQQLTSLVKILGSYPKAVL